MSNFGRTLFGGSRFVRWTLSPFLLLFVVLMPLMPVEKWSLEAVTILAGMEFICIALLMGFWLPAKFGQWAFRIVTGAVFLAYALYLIHVFFFADTSDSEALPSALLGFIVIGFPCLRYALLGSFRRKADKILQTNETV